MTPPTDEGPWLGGPTTELASCVLAPNPGPMTLDGTNTWVLSVPGSRCAVVVDPGPDLASHQEAVALEVERRGCAVALILLTHGHADHAEAAPALAARTGATVRALDPAHRIGSEGLVGGDVVDVDGLELRVISTPGHTSDSLSFQLPAEACVLTGDTALGRGTPFVQHPDGRLDAYFDSLARLGRLAETSEPTRVLPGHGPPVDDLAQLVVDYRRHRAERLRQVAAAVADGAKDAADVVRVVYADVDRRLWPAATMSVEAQLDYLRERGLPDGVAP